MLCADGLSMNFRMVGGMVCVLELLAENLGGWEETAAPDLDTVPESTKAQT